MFSSDLECSGRTALVGRPRAVCDEQAVGNPDRRGVEDGAEVERETRAARMIATGRIHEQDVRLLGETFDRLLKEAVSGRTGNASQERRGSIRLNAASRIRIVNPNDAGASRGRLTLKGIATP
jgi:hypothetical protein